MPRLHKVVKDNSSSKRHKLGIMTTRTENFILWKFIKSRKKPDVRLTIYAMQLRWSQYRSKSSKSDRRRSFSDFVRRAWHSLPIIPTCLFRWRACILVNGASCSVQKKVGSAVDIVAWVSEFNADSPNVQACHTDPVISLITNAFLNARKREF